MNQVRTRPRANSTTPSNFLVRDGDGYFRLHTRFIDCLEEDKWVISLQSDKANQMNGSGTPTFQPRHLFYFQEGVSDRTDSYRMGALVGPPYARKPLRLIGRV